MTNDVTELKQFAGLHAKAQDLGDSLAVLDRIHTDNGDESGSWAGEWSREAERLRRQGNVLAAAAHYNMARFPFVDGEARAQALDDCVRCFTGWAAQNGISRLDLTVQNGRIRCWTSGLSARRPRPVLVMCGGIVSIKEQWGPALRAITRLGFAGVVVEMPGVGENTMPYDADSWQLFSAVLDEIAGRADVSATYLLAFSFSGHLALRCALADRRIRGVVTAGAPVRHFFQDAAWHAALPRVTVDTLAHLTGIPANGLADALAPWALTGEQLAALDIPVGYAASARDEIIPAGDPALIAETVAQADVMTQDDVHGSPRFIAPTRLWAVHTILRMRGGRPVHRAAVAAALGMARWRTRISTAEKKVVTGGQADSGREHHDALGGDREDRRRTHSGDVDTNMS